MAPEIGRKYGPYEILSRLGGGGMGHVFRAWDARLHREVAIKLLHDEYTMAGMRERFLREARAASALNHPNICTIFDIGEQNGDPYLVMELLEGETLRDRIHHKTIQVEELICIAKEVAEALGAAHAKGVIHRDIKPANIFLVNKPNRGVQAKVLDFGLAKIEGGVLGARSSRSLDLTAVGATVGTLAYMSPEQARGESLDSRSDLFSLGVVMYEMATRQIPFQGATSALVFVQLLNHPPEPVRSWNESIPRELEKIILKLMAKERSARYQTAHELDEALSKLNDKGGGWLRKAVSTVPLVRAPDPVARDKRSPKRPSSNSQVKPLPEAPPSAGVIAPLTPRPLSDQAQMLRPVARLPRVDASSRPTGATEAAGAGSAVAQASPVPTSVVGAKTRTGSGSVVEDTVDGGASGEFKASPDLFGRSTFGDRRLSLNLGRGPGRAAFVGVGIVALTASVVFLLTHLHLGRGLVGPQDLVVVTEIENRTGDKVLDGTLSEGLRIALMESPYLRMRSGDSYRVARHSIAPDAGPNAGQPVAQHTAMRLGAKDYIFGTVTGSTPPYLIHLDLLNAVTNDVLTSADERVPSLQEIPLALDHLAQTMRTNAGESGDSIRGSMNPVSREATTNLEALHALSEGDDAYYSGRTMESLHLYQQAAALDPRFIEAQLKLAVLYRKQRAELASAEAAKLALAAADNASERTRSFAQYEYEMDASGDYARATAIIRKVTSANPHDPEAQEALARTLRLQGRMTEALQAAQQAYGDDPFDIDAYTQAENALIGLDRYDGAGQLVSQVQRLGLGHVGGALTSAYLEGRQDVVAAAVESFETIPTTFRLDWNYGLYLDNIGKLAAGSAVWHSRAAMAERVPGLESTAGFLLSQGAFDRALLGDCTGGLAMARESDEQPQGITALFNSGIAHALCGDSNRALEMVMKLQEVYPQSFAVNGFYVADIRAAVALHDLNAGSALDILRPARQYDLISLTPVLRGRADVALHKVQVGIVDFQTVLSHRGMPFIVGSVVYPVAEMGVARAFAATGDVGNSAEAYRRFLELWHSADVNQPLLNEARAHAH